MKNPAWTNNSRIRDVVKDAIADARVRLIAMIPHFEGAFFGEELTGEKPVHAWSMLKEKQELCDKVRALAYALLDHNAEVPVECAEWHEEEALLQRWQAFNEAMA